MDPMEQLKLSNKKLHYNRPNCRNKSTASFKKSELTIMSESKIIPSAYSGYGNHANQLCALLLTIPRVKVNKKNREREEKVSRSNRRAFKYINTQLLLSILCHLYASVYLPQFVQDAQMPIAEYQILLIQTTQISSLLGPLYMQLKVVTVCS